MEKILKTTAIDCVEQEEEFPGEMPDSLFETIKWGCREDDKEFIADVLRTVVRLTKRKIVKRLREIGES
jgi:hypothetical protein